MIGLVLIVYIYRININQVITIDSSKDEIKVTTSCTTKNCYFLISYSGEYMTCFPSYIYMSMGVQQKCQNSPKFKY